MTLVKCLFCKHTWNLQSEPPLIGRKIDDDVLKTPCPNCGLIRDLLYVGTDIVAMRTRFTPKDLEVIKDSIDWLTRGMIR